MSWAVAGIVAELVSAAAVLLTLIYIATQTRLTRLAVEESSKHATQQATNSAVETYSRWRSMTLGGTEVAEVLFRIRECETLSPKDLIVARAYFEELFYASATVYRSGASAASEHVASTTAEHLLHVIDQYPIAVKFWPESKPYVANVSEAFAREVDRLLAARMSEASGVAGAPPNKSVETDT